MGSGYKKPQEPENAHNETDSSRDGALMEAFLAGGLLGIAILKHKTDKKEARRRKHRDLKFMRDIRRQQRKEGKK